MHFFSIFIYKSIYIYMCIPCQLFPVGFSLVAIPYRARQSCALHPPSMTVKAPTDPLGYWT